MEREKFKEIDGYKLWYKREVNKLNIVGKIVDKDLKDEIVSVKKNM